MGVERSSANFIVSFTFENIQKLENHQSPKFR